MMVAELAFPIFNDSAMGQAGTELVTLSGFGNLIPLAALLVCQCLSSQSGDEAGAARYPNSKNVLDPNRLAHGNR